MLRICRLIFGSWKAVVLDSWFCVSKGTKELESKGIYVVALVKKQCYWPEGVPGDLIVTHFEDKKVGDVVMIKSRTEDNKLLKIFCMKEPDYVMRIMASWMTPDELEGARTRRDFIYRSGKKDIKQFTYRYPFGIHFRYRHQVYYHNNQIHAPISLDST